MAKKNWQCYAFYFPSFYVLYVYKECQLHKHRISSPPPPSHNQGLVEALGVLSPAEVDLLPSAQETTVAVEGLVVESISPDVGGGHRALRASCP